MLKEDDGEYQYCCGYLVADGDTVGCAHNQSSFTISGSRLMFGYAALEDATLSTSSVSVSASVGETSSATGTPTAATTPTPTPTTTNVSPSLSDSQAPAEDRWEAKSTGIGIGGGGSRPRRPLLWCVRMIGIMMITGTCTRLAICCDVQVIVMVGGMVTCSSRSASKHLGKCPKCAARGVRLR